MTVSIIVPVYNTKEYIETCINSILNQTYKNLEIIIVDDGSTDGSSEICDYFSSIDERIIVYHQKNLGVASARNLGLENVHGDFIAWVDSDDSIAPTYIEDLINTAQTYSSPFVMSYNNKDYRKIFVYNQNNCIVKNFLLGNFDAYLWSTLIKKELYNGLKFDQIKIGEDALILLQMLLRTNKFVYFYNNGYHYTKRIGSASSTKDYISISTWYYGINKQKEIIESNIPSLKKVMNYKMVKHIFLFDDSLRNYNNKKAKNLRIELRKMFFKCCWNLPWKDIDNKHRYYLIKFTIRYILLSIIS